MTYYLDIEPAGWEPDGVIARYEMAVEADSTIDAIVRAKEDPNVVLVTNVREQSRSSRKRYPEDAGARLARGDDFLRR